ncbi:MAG: hypothetical protein QXN61_05775, partial [Zestosphaera sp.]
EVADATIELCDGMPSFVESELEYWLNVVKRYCPWNTKVIAEEQFLRLNLGTSYCISYIAPAMIY